HCPTQWRERLTAVAGADVRHRQRADAVEMERVGEQLAVILWIVRVPVALLRPGLAAVGGAEEAGLSSLRGYGGVNDVGVLGGDREPDSTNIDGRKAGGEPFERRATVRRLIDPSFGTAADEQTCIAPSLIPGCVDDV